MTAAGPTPPILRLYIEEEIQPGTHGYPIAWGRCVTCFGEGKALGGACPTCCGAGSAKALVRELAGHRCVRCGHPYVCGESNPEWSPCDEGCLHHGPIRWREGDGPWLSETHTPRAGVGVRNGWTVQAKRRVLTVHHLLKSHEEKRDCRWWNLAALCQRCHLQVQGKVTMSTPWPFEHSDWFKPYAAGYYASTILGEELSRAETEARLDELLALEHRQHRLDEWPPPTERVAA